MVISALAQKSSDNSLSEERVRRVIEVQIFVPNFKGATEREERSRQRGIRGMGIRGEEGSEREEVSVRTGRDGANTQAAHAHTHTHSP